MQDKFDLAQRLNELSTDRRELLRKLLAAKARKPIQRRDPSERVPLTFSQQRLWIVDQLLEGKAAYNETNLIRLRLPLDVEAFRRAINEIIRRHEMLRTTISSVDGAPFQHVSDSLTIEIPVVDLRGQPLSEREPVALRMIEEAWRVPMDLEHGPLIRGTLYRLDASDYMFALTLHHLVCDGWSMGVFATELSCLYWSFVLGRLSPLPELEIQFGDFAVWQRKALSDQLLAPQLEYWTAQLKDLPALNLPTDRPRPPQFTYQGSRVPIRIANPLFASLVSLAEQNGVTLQMLLTTALFVLLHKYTGQEDVAIGAPISGRNRKELEPLIGFFVNTLVLRVDVSGDPSFRELLRRVRQISVAAYAHEDVPFERLVEALHVPRDASRNPLVQVVLQLFQPPSATGLEREHIFPFVPAPAGGSKFDLHFELLGHPEKIEGFVEYNTDLFDEQRVRRMVSHLERLLQGIVADPEGCLSRLPLLSDEERQCLLVDWNDTTADYPRDATIPATFAEYVATRPDATALECETTVLSYAEVNAKAEALAAALIDRGISRGDTVGLLLERSIELPIAMLGILKAGAVYVPLDVRYPADRLSYLLADSGAKCVVTSAFLQEAHAQLDCPRILVDQLRTVGAAAVSVQIAPDDVAYLLYTSGTTGKPKGVPLTHRNALRLVKAPSLVPIMPSDTMLHFAPITFDASVFEIWGALLNGAKLVLHPPEMPSLDELATFIKDTGITVLFLTTGLFAQMIEQYASHLRSVRQLVTGGEALTLETARAAWQQLPRTRIVNAYGPTECSTIATAYALTGREEIERSVPIGKPIENTTVYIVDPHGHPVPVGVPGEICIGGDAVAPGYWKRPGLTELAFIPDGLGRGPRGLLYRTGDVGRYRADGNIEFLGRRDRQVKLSGYRIELGEIESALGSHPDVSSAALVAVEHDANPRLVAFIEAVPSRGPTPSELRRHLEALLPNYMVPTHIEILERLPRTPTGKIDFPALTRRGAAPAGGQNEYLAPRTAVEQVLANIWQEVLVVQRPSVTADFFALGGQSLVATRLLTRIRDALQVSVTMREFFAAPTIRGLAAIVAQNEEASKRAGWLAVVERIPMTSTADEGLQSALLDARGQ